ncbi:MAG: substrate-binding domain-containing protein [Nocardioides sp.]
MLRKVRSNGARRLASVAAASVVVFGLAACGDDGGTSGGDTGGGGGGDTVDIGVILPDATTSPRWEANDKPSLSAAFDAAGVTYDIQNAQGDTAKFGQLCDTMIGEGIKVLMIVNLDSDSGSACLKKAADAGVQSIDYDRLTLGGGASYYVSFDNEKVGELMGTGLIAALDAEGKTKANIVYVNGAATDNNAALFKSGYEAALKDKIGSGDYTLVGDQSGEWDATKAGTVFEQMLTDNKGKIDGAVVANDTMAGGVIARLKPAGLAGKIPTTGQDASVEGLQNILLGYQAGTVYKNTNLEADAASKLAIALINDDQAAADALATGSVMDSVTNQEVPSALAIPEWITADTVAKVIADGFQSAADVCTGKVAKACAKYGVQ